MKRIAIALSALLLSCFAAPAFAALKVLACEPEWAALATEIGGDKVQASSATTAFQAPHRSEARPSLIARTRNADLLVCTGRELEIGWLPILLQQSGNPRIVPGQPGYLDAGSLVTRLAVPTRDDRSQGDEHPAGNPHNQQDPRNIARIADALVQRKSRIAAGNAANYQSPNQAFSARW